TDRAPYLSLADHRAPAHARDGPAGRRGTAQGDPRPRERRHGDRALHTAAAPIDRPPKSLSAHLVACRAHCDRFGRALPRPVSAHGTHDSIGSSADLSRRLRCPPMTFVWHATWLSFGATRRIAKR